MARIKQFGFTPILGWSSSRYDKFLSCRRQYYYEYYGKHDREFPSDRIARLKMMTSVPLETGTIVHEVIKTLLERLLVSERPIDRGRFSDYTARLADEHCRTKVFSEVYYKERSAVNPGEIVSAAKLSLDNFLGSERFVCVTGKALRHKSGWIIEPPGFGETRIDGLKAYCKVDFLFPSDDGLFILDWKTGKRDDVKHGKQLIGYTSWASYHFDMPAERITPMAAYLQPAYIEVPAPCSGQNVKDFVQAVHAETREMYALCANVEQNIPRDKQEFPKTSRTVLCRYCNYRELCANTSHTD